MNKIGQITVLAALAVTASVAPAYAQQGSHFQRVTTTAAGDSRSPSARIARTGPTRNFRSPTADSRLAGRTTTSRTSLASSRAQSDVLHPYATRAALESEENHGPDGGDFSTWRDEEPKATPAPRAIAPPRSHNYYPGLRSGRYASQPVTLTANQGFLLPRTCCSASRSHFMAAAGSQSLSGMGGSHH